MSDFYMIGMSNKSRDNQYSRPTPTPSIRVVREKLRFSQRDKDFPIFIVTPCMLSSHSIIIPTNALI